jgi:uridine phosphorylase
VTGALYDAAMARGEDVHRGPIVTDDAFYNETDAYVDAWEAAGILAIEMEAAAIFTLARRKGLQAGAICTAHDNIERAIGIALAAAAALG